MTRSAVIFLIAAWFIATTATLTDALAVDIPLTYQRTPVIFQLNAPTGEAQSGKVAFNVEMRHPESVADIPDWYKFSIRDDYSGAMLVYPHSDYISLLPNDDVTPADLVFINAYGEVVQILPSIALSTLAEPLPSPKPVMAMIYLKQGTSEKLGIVPGDVVKHKLFRKRPVVITQPPAPVKPPMPPEPPTPLEPPSMPWNDPQERPAANQPGKTQELFDTIFKSQENGVTFIE